MTPPDTTLPTVRKSRLITRDVVLWSTAALLAAGYLLVLGLAPGILEDLTPSTVLSPQSSEGQRAAAKLAGDVKTLRDSVAQIQLDLAKVRTDVAGYGESHKVLAQEVAALSRSASADPAAAAAATQQASTVEAVMPPAAPAPQAQPQPQAKSQAAKTVAAAPAEVTTTQSLDPATTTVMPKVINGSDKDQLASMETGSVNAPATASAIDFGPALVKKAPKPVGVRISSGASVDSLRLSWSLLSDKHADTLKNLEARYVDKGDASNPNFDLVAGPLKSKADAVRVCKALAAKNVPCKVGDFTGEAL